MIYAWDEVSGLNIWRFPAGRQSDQPPSNLTSTGAIIANAGPLLEPGTNGLLYHSESHTLLACNHGFRAVTALHAKHTTSGAFGGNTAQYRVLQAVKYGEKKLNSPNDLSLALDGTLFVTDPSYGLKRVWSNVKPEQSPGRERDANCVYALHGVSALLTSAGDVGAAKLSKSTVTCAIERPNGIAVFPSQTVEVAGTTRVLVGDSSRDQSYWVVSHLFLLLFLC